MTGRLPLLLCVLQISCGGETNTPNVHDGGGAAGSSAGCFAPMQSLPSGCYSCAEANSKVRAEVLQAAASAGACSTDSECVLSPAAVVPPCLFGCPAAVSSQHLPEYKAALSAAKSSEFCVCTSQPDDCPTIGQLGCVAGRCQPL